MGGTLPSRRKKTCRPICWERFPPFAGGKDHPARPRNRKPSGKKGDWTQTNQSCWGSWSYGGGLFVFFGGKFSGAAEGGAVDQEGSHGRKASSRPCIGQFWRSTGGLAKGCRLEGLHASTGKVLGRDLCPGRSREGDTERGAMALSFFYYSRGKKSSPSRASATKGTLRRLHPSTGAGTSLIIKGILERKRRSAKGGGLHLEREKKTSPRGEPSSKGHKFATQSCSPRKKRPTNQPRYSEEEGNCSRGRKLKSQPFRPPY